jgi:hypothetical protein
MPRHGEGGNAWGQEAILDCGLRPLRAVGSIYEPEAAGAIGAYAPEGFVVSLRAICFYLIDRIP